MLMESSQSPSQSQSPHDISDGKVDILSQKRVLVFNWSELKKNPLKPLAGERVNSIDKASQVHPRKSSLADSATGEKATFVLLIIITS